MSTPHAYPRTWTSLGAALARRPPSAVSVESEPRAAEGAARYGFLVGPLGLLVARATTGEILDDPVIFPVPNTAEWLLGMVNQRGALVPVFDLAALLDAPCETVARLLVVGTGNDAVAFPVAELPRTVRTRDAIDPRPSVPAPFEGHTRAAYLEDEQLWLEVDLDGLLTELSAEISR